jgi:hypothetical protein
VTPPATPIIVQSTATVPPGDPVWQAARAAGRLVTWPDAMPPASNPTTLTVSANGQLFLLSNGNFVAMLGSPANINTRGALLGFFDRNYGVDFFRTPTNVMADAYQYCVGNQTLYDGYSTICPSSGKPDWHFSRDTVPTCWIEDVNGNSLGSCANGASAPVLVFSFTTNDGTVAIQERYRLDGTGLYIQPRQSGHPGSYGITTLRAFMFNNLGQDITSHTTETVLGLAYNEGLAYPNAEMDGLDLFRTNQSTMPFFGFVRGQDAIYVAAEDTQMTPREFDVTKPSHCYSDCSSSLSFIGLFPTHPGPSADPIVPTWWVHLLPVHGDRDWAMLTDQYKAWARTNRPLTLLAQRTDLPQMLKDGPFWMLYYSLDNGPASDFTKYWTQIHGNITTAPFAVHLYNYYGPWGFDRGNGVGPSAGLAPKTPSMMTCGPKGNASCGSWPDAVATVQATGDVVAPYMNPNDADVCDLATPGCAHGGSAELVPSACKNPAGNPTQVPYNLWGGWVRAGGYLVPMDPRTSFWRSKFLTMWYAVNSLKARGIYLDTYAIWPFGCWPDGYLPSIVQASQDLVTQIHTRYATDGLFLVSESNRDIFLGGPLDMNLNYSYAMEHGAPLFQAVYHPYVPIAGPANFAQIDTGIAYYIKYARSWAWGNQIGLTDAAATQFPGPRVNYINTLVADHLALKRFLAYGEVYSPMLAGVTGPSDTTLIPTWNRVPEGDATQQVYSVTLPLIYGLYWTDAAGEMVLVYTNADPAASHTAYAKIPTELQGSTITECAGDETGCADFSSHLRNNGTELVLTPAANAARVVKFVKR